MTNPVDPETGAPLKRGIRPLTLAYKGESITIDMPGWYGDSPDDGILEPEDMKISDRALNRLKAKVEGVLDPDTIRQIRKKLKITQKEAGLLIGGGPNAFQKYESGEVLASHAITSALLLLDQNPSGLALLKERVEHPQAA